MKQHKWHKEIKAWADGAEIEHKYTYQDEWKPANNPTWHTDLEFRIKPQPKEPDYTNIAKEHYARLRKYGEMLLENACVNAIEEFMEKNKPQPKEPQYGAVITGRPVGNLWLEEHEARIAALEERINPKEPQYLYVYFDTYVNRVAFTTEENSTIKTYRFLGKIKLEVDDE